MFLNFLLILVVVNSSFCDPQDLIEDLAFINVGSYSKFTHDLSN